MTTEKFETEISTLKKFYECYCKNKHKNQTTYKRELLYKDLSLNPELKLCKECFEEIQYCFDRLLECPHEEKPRCRDCSNPCYEKIQWKKTAKVMMYSGILLGLSNKFKKIFKRK